MKTPLLTIAVLALTVISAYSQGSVIFRNSFTTPITFAWSGQVGETPGTPLPSGTRFLVELYYAPDGPDPGDAGMMGGLMGPAVGIADVPPDAGRYNGGTRTTPSLTAPAQRAWFQVRAWESLFGATYEEAVAAGPIDVGGIVRCAYHGRSARFNIATGGLFPTPITVSGGVNAFTVDAFCVPEPSLTFLGLLGGFTGLLLRAVTLRIAPRKERKAAFH